MQVWQEQIKKAGSPLRKDRQAEESLINGRFLLLEFAEILEDTSN